MKKIHKTEKHHTQVTSKRVKKLKSIHSASGKHISIVPSEILALNIFSYFSDQELLRLRLVSKNWKNLIDRKFDLWRDRFSKFGGKPKNTREQFFIAKTVLDVGAQSIYEAINVFSSSVVRDIGDRYIVLGYEKAGRHYHDCLNQISKQLLFAHCVGISTYTLFNETLKYISGNDSILLLYYFIFITNVHNINNYFTNSDSKICGAYLGLTVNDYRDIEKLFNEILKNLSEHILNFKHKSLPGKNLLDYAIHQGYNLFNTPLRPSPRIIRLLINIGFDFNYIPNSSYNDNEILTFIDLLLIYEVLFHSKFFTRQKVSFFSGYSYTSEIDMKLQEQKRIYLREYGDFVGPKNLHTTIEQPLSNEFLDLAKVVITKGGVFSSYEEITEKLSQDQVVNKLIDLLENGEIESSLDERFKNACGQLKKLQDDNNRNVAALTLKQ